MFWRSSWASHRCCNKTVTYLDFRFILAVPRKSKTVTCPFQVCTAPEDMIQMQPASLGIKILQMFLKPVTGCLLGHFPRRIDRSDVHFQSFQLQNQIKNGRNTQKSGQIIIFHQPRFPWNKEISLTFHHHLGEIGRVRSRANLTRKMDIC